MKNNLTTHFHYQVFKPRPLVDLSAAVSSALLINEPQWVGIIVKPIDYSLKGAVLHVDTGPGLRIDESHVIEMESHGDVSQTPAKLGYSDDARNDGSTGTEEFKQLTLNEGRIELPEWAGDINSVLWIPVRAISESLARGTSAGERMLKHFSWFSSASKVCVQALKLICHMSSVGSCSPATECCGWVKDNCSET